MADNQTDQRKTDSNETRDLVIALTEACRAATRSLAESLPFVDDDDPYLGKIFGQVAQRNDQGRAMLRSVTRRAERWLLNYGDPARQGLQKEDEHAIR